MYIITTTAISLHVTSPALYSYDEAKLTIFRILSVMHEEQDGAVYLQV